MDIYRGRLIDHVQIVANDIEASKKFYRSILSALDIPLGGEASDHLWADELFISSKESPAAQGQLTGRVHLALQAHDEQSVQKFHAAGIKAGGRDNGPPGARPYHPGYYAAFVLDPDGNNIEAVYHGPARRSGDSVKISF
ncbi:MAG TPA: VOC family protein [Oligoflexus sp.]|uniref:VOC family protein n=1 Tax=Oligoflexus sp. TaxID=1971216 RepID=UPI002D3E06F8|nr:VOC family protein [Oligoflexus sp.]HYX36055.1 VOC family protein [Oligoflexus sp.]